LAAALVSVLGSGGCAVGRVPPIGSGGDPFRLEGDERALWAQAEKEEERLARTGKIYVEAPVDAYLASIAARLVPSSAQAAGGPAIRIVVLRDPTLNAFSMPNGMVYVHTGLLARVDNEAQLAAVLAREIAHVTHRHAFEWSRGARTPPVPAAAATGAPVRDGTWVTTDVVRTAPNVFLGLPLAFVAAVRGFGGALEREADVAGLDRMVAAGYDPREAPKVFGLLKRDHGDSERIERFFLGNPARLDERIRVTRAWIEHRYAGGDGGRLAPSAENFQRRMRVVVRENALLDIRAGRFHLAQAQLDRVLALAADDPPAHLYYGDLQRLQAQQVPRPSGPTPDTPALLTRARAEYERAAALDPAYPEPYRQLGLLYYQDKDTRRAREAFERYLALRPDAPDARRIKEYLAELAR
jgi:predicted Zn-dependent protease